MKRSALLIGLNKEGKILLHHKTADAPTNANLWVLMGGSIEQGEEPQAAMSREIQEELNLEQAIASQQTTLMEDKGVLISEKVGRNKYVSLRFPKMKSIVTCLENCCNEQ